MALPEDQFPPEMLKYQTWVLKVCIDCEGCKKKVKKVLQGIEGVYTTTVDAQQHKVIVTGNVDAQTLIKKLARSGKYTELWPEKMEQMPRASKANQKQIGPLDGHDLQEGNGQKDSQEMAAKKPGNAPKSGEKGGFKNDKAPSTDQKDGGESDKYGGGESDEVGGAGGGIDSEEGSNDAGVSNNNKKKKKKKKKGQTSNPSNNMRDTDAGNAPEATRPPSSEAATPELVQPMPQVNFSPPNTLMLPYPPVYYAPPAYGISYSNVPYPTSVNSYYAATPMHASAYSHPVMTLPRYDPIKVDDNHHYNDNDDDGGCSIM